MRISDWSSDGCSSDLRPPKLGLVDPDALSDTAGIHAIANSLDHAGAVLMRDNARIWVGAHAAARAGLGVGRVDPRGMDSPQHFPGPGLGLGSFPNGQQAGRAAVRESVCSYVEITGFAVT